MSEEEDGETRSTSARHWLTNDIAALSITETLCLLMLLDLTPWYSASQRLELGFIAGFTVAVVWLFGSKAAQAAFGGGNQ